MPDRAGVPTFAEDILAQDCMCGCVCSGRANSTLSTTDPLRYFNAYQHQHLLIQWWQTVPPANIPCSPLSTHKKTYMLKLVVRAVLAQPYRGITPH